MEPGRAPAPDLFAALDWSARVAPGASDEAPPAPTNGAAHATTAAAEPARATPPEPRRATPPEPRRATPPQPRRATPSLPEQIAARTQGLPPPPSATPERATGSFGGLADLLEPDAEASPSLDELDGLLEAFDDTGSGALPAQASAPAPAARTEVAPPHGGLPLPRPTSA
ncbi:MAG TPA: hypothetical protein VG755_05140, partial [Nannocystaceae bacterium]|nr:hypothetical protein [Nannocystaceae bacterium]